jgi:predicted peroxiredoxin
MAEPGLGLFVFDGGYERVHYALSIAAAALAINRPVGLLFSGPAVEALRPDGWSRLADPDGIAARQEAAGVADAETLYDACITLGARVTVCEMSLAARSIGAADLRLGTATGGIVGFLADRPAGAQLLFI